MVTIAPQLWDAPYRAVVPRKDRRTAYTAGTVGARPFAVRSPSAIAAGLMAGVTQTFTEHRSVILKMEN